MTHVSDEVLAAIALDDPEVDPAERAHVDDCPVCSEELAEVAQVHALLTQEARLAQPVRVDPGPAVWWGVLEEIDRPAATERRVDGSLDGRVDPPVRAVPVDPVAGRHAEPGPRRRWWVAAVAAAALVVGVVGGRVLWGRSDVPTPRVVASVPLTSLDAAKRQEGTAQLLDATSGRQLRIDTTAMSSGPGYLEVWLLNTDGKRMVSLGVLAANQATFALPADALAQGYTTVDVSQEQFDDQPQHSGDSVMRGSLPV